MLVGTLVYTFGTLAFLSFFIFWLSERHQGRHTHAYCSGSEHLVGGVFLLICAAWFGLNFLETLADQGGRASPVVDLTLLIVAFLFPPTMMHNLYVGNEATVAGFWKYGIGTVYVVSLVSILLAFAISLQLVGPPLNGLMPSLVFLLNVLFIIALGFLIHLNRRSGRGREGGREGMSRRWFAGLMSLMLVLIAEWLSRRIQMWCGYLIAFIGVVFLLSNLGMLPYEAWDYIWPLLLIVWGIGIAWGRPGFWCVLPGANDGEKRTSGARTDLARQ